MSYLTCIILLFTCISANAQNSSSFQLDYKPIKQEKNIPSHVQKYLQLGDEKKSVLIGDFYMNQLIKNGMVYFNGNITDYLNDMLKKIIDNNTELNKNSKVFLCKDVFPVIFSNTNNDILISTGMVSKLASEEQLAFLFAKELVHISQKTPFVSYAKKKDIEKEFLKNGITLREVSNHFFRGLTHQIQASEKAIELIHNARMDVTKAKGAYNGLMNIPEFEIDFEKVFRTDSIKIDPLLFKINSSEKINYNKTAPLELREFGINIQSDTLEEKINKIRKSKGTYFGSSDSLFNYFKKIASFEVVSNSFQNHQFVESALAAIILLQFYPENQYLQEYILKNLFWISHYKSINKFSEIIDHSNQDINYLSLCKFLIGLNSNHFLKFYYLLSLDKKNKFPQNEEISLLYVQAKEQLKGIVSVKDDYQSFLREFPGSTHSEFVRNKLLSLINSN